MKQAQRSTRCRPRLEALETREMPLTLHVVGPVPGSHSKGPYLNLIVDRPSTPAVQATAAPFLIEVDSRRYDSLLGESGHPPAGRRFAVCSDNHHDHDHDRRPDIPARDLLRPAADRGRDPPRDLLDRVRRPLLRRRPPVLEPVGHDPHLQQRPRRDVQSVAQRPRQLLLLPPADPTASPTTNDPMAGQVAGLLSFFPANVLQSGSSLFAEITNLPGVASSDPEPARPRAAVARAVHHRSRRGHRRESTRSPLIP